ncbi:MAG: tyrosine-protein phosphatase [Acidobacteriota bacterium]
MRNKLDQIALSMGLLKKSVSPIFILALLLILCSQVLPRDRKAGGSARANKDPEQAKPAVKNFGRIGDHLFRGAQPRAEDYSVLAKLGIKTVIDLRDDPLDYARERAIQAGLQYISFPLSDHDYPQADAADKFLSLVSTEANWPIFIHCAGGRHRTGVMTAVYRMTVEGWDIERAYKEMKEYDFYTRFGHQVMKDFIFDYSAHLKEKRSVQLASSPHWIWPQAPDSERPPK